jgi:thymidylate kinase
MLGRQWSLNSSHKERLSAHGRLSRTMKIVVAIEGVDGSGKSSLAQFIQQLCQQHGRSCSLIGRRAGFISPAILKVSDLLREEVRNLTPHADVFLRIAREFQRAHMATLAPQGVVVLDRFVLTVLSLARIYGHDVELITQFLRDIAARADLRATIFVHCPFEVAWTRAGNRGDGLSSNKRRGEKLLRRVAEFMVEDFHRGLLTGQQWPVDNSKEFKDCEEQVANYLIPYLEE